MERIPRRRRADAHRVSMLGELIVTCPGAAGDPLPIHGGVELAPDAGSARLLDVRHAIDGHVSLVVEASGAVQLDGSLWVTVTLELDPPPASMDDGCDAWSTVLPSGGICPFTLALDGPGGRRIDLRGALEHHG